MWKRRLVPWVIASFAACAPPDPSENTETPLDDGGSTPKEPPTQVIVDAGRSGFDDDDVSLATPDDVVTALDVATSPDAPTASDVVTTAPDVVMAAPDVVTAMPDVVSAPSDRPTVPEMRCRIVSTTYDAAMEQIDVGPTSSTRLRFTVPGVPAGVTAATLRFDSFDADHPMQEGRIAVNGRGALDLPANTAWDNVTLTGNSVDVSALVTAGANVIEFGPGPLSRSFFGIGRVSLDVTARVTSCGSVTPPPTMTPPTTPTGGRPVERRQTYAQATWMNRNNVVFRCSAQYAYTARGADHLSEDCGGLYAPDGTLRARGTWTFPSVVAAQYDVVISSRHSSNRNAAMALFVVNGESHRIDQRTGAGSLTVVEDVWGRRALSGTVTVVLDATTNRGSDSVSEVILRPVP